MVCVLGKPGGVGEDDQRCPVTSVLEAGELSQAERLRIPLHEKGLTGGWPGQQGRGIWEHGIRRTGVQINLGGRVCVALASQSGS